MPHEKAFCKMILQLIIAALLGALLRDLQVWCAAKVYCWRKRRQEQRCAAEGREQREQRVQGVLAKTSGDTLNAYPFVIEPRNEFDGLLASREIVILLRSQDKTRFFANESEGEAN